MSTRSPMILLPVVLLLAACTTMPKGPSMLVLPGTGQGFEQFRTDELVCRDYANTQVGGRDAQAASEDAAVRSAALGAALGAVAGAVIDGQRGAGVGAGTGLLFGGLAGTGTGPASGQSLQVRYDNAYLQCMYAKGHQVPIRGRMAGRAPAGAIYPPPPPRRETN